MSTKTTQDAQHGRPIDIGLDWVSFTVKRSKAGNENVMLEDVRDFIDAYFPEFEIEQYPRKKIARSPYNVAYKLGVGGVVMANVLLNHFLVELQGRGCRNLINSDQIDDTIKAIQYHSYNITRVDVAVDIQTTTMPADFVKLRAKTFKNVGANDSQTGSTRYVGSSQSRRFCRVYRYFKPHERSHLLRIEFVIKKPDAGALLQAYAADAKKCAADLGNTFGYTHPDWNLESDEKIKGWRPERGKASTLRWVRKAVIPALQKLIEDDIVDKNHPIWLEFEGTLPLRWDCGDED